MQKITLFILLITISFAGYSQFWTEDFSNPSYEVVLGGEGSDGDDNYFMTTDGSDIEKTYDGVNGNFFAGQDLDDGGWEGSASPSQIQWSGIDISGQTNIQFSGSFGEVFDDPGDIDNLDSLLLQYRIDGGEWMNLIAFRNDGSQYNTDFLEDTDFDGIGDGTNITSDNGTMISFTKSIPGTGSSLDLLFTAQVDAGDEDFAIDGFQLGAEGGNALPSITNIEYTPEIITSSDPVSVSAEVSDSDGTLTAVELHWGTTSGSLTNTINMSATRATYTTDSPIPAQPDETTVYFEIYAQDNEGGETTSSELSYTVTDPASTTLPYNQYFDSGLGEIYTYSVSGGSKEWIWDEENDNGYAEMNGYNSGDTEVDWLILPSIYFDGFNHYEIYFTTWYNYGSDDENNYLKFYYSTDYEGLGDPSEANWTELDFNHPSEPENWQLATLIPTDNIEGQAYLGFKYQYEPGMYRQWKIDDIEIDIFTGIHESLTPENDMTVYPNPSNGIFTINMKNKGVANISVLSVLGDKVYEAPITNYNQSIDLTDLSKGVYLLKLETKNHEIYKQKIVIR